jgi:hypothetical protein
MAKPPTLPPGWKQIPPQTNSKVGIAYSTTVPDPNNPGENLTLYAITDKQGNITEYTYYDSNKQPLFNKTQNGDPLPAPGSNLSAQAQTNLITLATTQNTALATSLGGTPNTQTIPGYPGPTANGDILFDLLDPDKLPVKFGDVDSIIKKMARPLNYPEDALYNKTQDHLSISQYSYTPPRSNDIFGDALNTLQKGSKRISPLKKLLGMVNLPMPNNITDSNNVSWGDDNMNNLSAALTSYVAKNAVMTGVGALALNAGAGAAGAGAGAAQTASLILALRKMHALNPNNTTPEMKTLLGGSINSRILSMLGVSVSPESILARGYGIVPNSNLELLFNAPTLREFTFQYRMSPRSKGEAKIVNNIIRFFKQGMAAKKQNGLSGAQSYFLGTPNVFQLQYKTTGGKTIKGVNRIKTCALTGFAMNYAADGNWAAYDDGQPVSVIMNMSFKELEPVYDTDYQEDIFDGRTFTGKDGSGDLYPITPDEVGY